MKEIYRKNEDEEVTPIISDTPWTLKLPNLGLKNLYEGIENRRIWIDDIDTFLLDSLSKSIIKYNLEDKDIPVEERKPIYIFIYSFGGDVSVMNSLIDIITLSKTPVYGFNMGICCSAASLVYLACHKRYTLRRAEYLIHQGSTGVQANTNQLFDVVDNIKEIENSIKDFIISKTKIDAKLYKKNERKEWYIKPEEQIELGISDGIIESIDEIL